MSRRIRDHRLETREARSRLAVAHRPYWRLIHSGLRLGYRKGPRGGSWWVQIGDTRRVLAGADDYQDADGSTILDYAQAQQKAVGLAKTPDSRSTVATAMKRYLEAFGTHRRDHGTLTRMFQTRVLPRFGDTLLSELRTADLSDWLHAQARRPAQLRTGFGRDPKYRPAAQDQETIRRRQATANRLWTYFRAALNKAFRDGLTTKDYEWRRVRPFRNVEKPRIRFLTGDESVRLCNAAEPDFRSLLRGALLTGARYGELTVIEAGDVDLDHGAVYIRPGKSGRARHVPLNAEGLELFQSLVLGHERDAAVFVRADGRPWGRNEQNRPLLETCERARIKPIVRFHELRHTYASLLAQAGADILTISRLLGHADTRITSRNYAHLTDKTLREAVNLLPSFGSETHRMVIGIHEGARRHRESGKRQ